MAEFKEFEEAAFYGKLTTIITGLVLRKLLGDRVQPEYKTPYKFVDFFIKGVGFVEVSASSNLNTDRRRRLYNLSKLRPVYFLVPKRLVKEFNETIDLDFKFPQPQANLPPSGTHRNRITVISLVEFLYEIEKKINVPKRRLHTIIKQLRNLNQLLKLTQSILKEWREYFI